MLPGYFTGAAPTGKRILHNCFLQARDLPVFKPVWNSGSITDNKSFLTKDSGTDKGDDSNDDNKEEEILNRSL